MHGAVAWHGTRSAGQRRAGSCELLCEPRPCKKSFSMVPVIINSSNFCFPTTVRCRYVYNCEKVNRIMAIPGECPLHITKLNPNLV